MNAYEIMLRLIRFEMTGALCDNEIVEAINQSYKNGSDEQMFNDIFYIACCHDLAHIVGFALYRLNLLPDSGIGVEFRNKVLMAVSRYEGLEYELSAIKRTLENHGIPYIMLKGAVMRRHYLRPWMRTSCDLDILIHEDALTAASQALIDELNYEFGIKGKHDVTFYAPGGTHLELHYSLVDPELRSAADRVIVDVWNHAHRVSDQSHEYALSDAMFYYYHIAHMAKHFVQGGCGIRPFIDIKILMELIDVNSDEVRTLLVSGGLDLFARNVQKLAGVWFGELEHDSVTRNMETYLLYGGVYGSLDNKIAVEQGVKGGKWEYLRDRIWLPYDRMKNYYPSVASHRKLIFFYQIRRWFRIIFTGKMKRPMVEMSINSSMAKSRVEETSSLLSQLGLNL